MQLAALQKKIFEDLQQPQASSPGIRIYQNSMRSTLFHTLGKIFPAAKRLVGEAFFTRLAWDYIDQNPSFSPNLNDYGIGFPEHIKASSTAKLPYFFELAKLEWAWHKSFYGPDNKAVNFERLNKAIREQAENIIFKLPKGCQLLKFNYAVNKIWESCQPEYQGKFDFELQGPLYLALLQLEGKIVMIDLNLADWTFLSYLSKGLPLLKICEEVEYFDLSKLCKLHLIDI